MATVQVRDVPDDVAEIIAAKARSEHTSVSGYLRKLMAADAKVELQKRAIAHWNEELKKIHKTLNFPDVKEKTGAEVIREIRDEYDQGAA